MQDKGCLNLCIGVWLCHFLADCAHAGRLGKGRRKSDEASLYVHSAQSAMIFLSSASLPLNVHMYTPC